MTDADWARLELRRHALHAADLELPNPIARRTLSVTAPSPDDLGAF